MAKPTKPIPQFADEAQERAHWEAHDSTVYVDWSHARKVTLPNLKPTTQTISSAVAAASAGLQQNSRQCL